MSPDKKPHCPCQSGKSYSECCRRYHDGEKATTCKDLMRSRYSAYALHLFRYLMDTTHPKNIHFVEDRDSWRIQILEFVEGTEFLGVDIINWTEEADEGTVTFRARLMRGAEDISFREKSYFVREEGQWFYRDALYVQKDDLKSEPGA